MGYTIRKEVGTRSPLRRNKRKGYALYKNGSAVFPKFRNWYPTKKEAEKAASRSRREERELQKPRRKRKKRKK